MDKNAVRAAHNLTHYFTLIAEKQGLKLDSDSRAEIENIVEFILDAAKEYTDKAIDEAIDSHNGAKVSHMN